MNNTSIYLKALEEASIKEAISIAETIVDRDQYAYGVGLRAGLKFAINLIKNIDSKIKELENAE